MNYQLAKGNRRNVFLLSCGYFIVYAAQFLRSSHDAGFVAVLVHIPGVLDSEGVTGALKAADQTAWVGRMKNIGNKESMDVISIQ